MGKIERLTGELASAIDRERVKTDSDITDRYAVGGLAPSVVAFPKDIRQVKEIVNLAVRDGISIFPWGSGTKQCMGDTPSRVELVISTEKMNHMLDVDVANLTITVEAGVKFRDIQARLATQEDRCYLPLDELGKETDDIICSERTHSGCFLPMDPPFSAGATIGGIIATNSFGPRRLLYGLPRDMVLGVRFVTPKGEIVGAGGKTVKNVSGYDVSKLMIGSFGTLGIICEMTLRLLPLPERMETMILGFASLSEAARFAEALLRTKLIPAALEIMNEDALDAVCARAGISAKAAVCNVAVAMEGFDEAVGRMKKEMAAMGDRLGAAARLELDEAGHNPFWLSFGNMRVSDKEKSSDILSVRLSYPISEWEKIYSMCDETLAREGLKHTMVCHAGSGITVVDIMPDGKDSHDLLVKTVSALREGCKTKGGQLTVECAPSNVRSSVKTFDRPGAVSVIMERLKKAIDPSGIMNPGRFFSSNPHALAGHNEG